MKVDRQNRFAAFSWTDRKIMNMNSIIFFTKYFMAKLLSTELSIEKFDPCASVINRRDLLQQPQFHQINDLRLENPPIKL